MIYTSPFPDCPPYPDTNCEHILFGRDDQKEWPDYTIYVDANTGRRTTFRQFHGRVLAGATALTADVAQGGLGILPNHGEMVAIISENSTEYSNLIHSLLAVTIPFALIASYSTKFELEHSLRLSDTTRIFVQEKLLPNILPIAKQLGIPSNHVYVIGGHVKKKVSFSGAIMRTLKAKLPQAFIHPASRDTLAYLVFSSGTTGLPKAVMISHGNIISASLQMVTAMVTTLQTYQPPVPDRPEGVPAVLAFLPMHHTYGLHAYVFRSMFGRSTFVFMSRWDVDTALQIIPKYRITDLTLVPSVVPQLLSKSKARKVDLSSLRSISSGAAYLPPEMADELLKRMPTVERIGEGWGMSETTIAGIVQPYPKIMNNKLKPLPRGSAGILLSGLKGRIVREDGTDASVNEPGELLLNGPNIALGYWKNEKATRDTFRDGWLYTGDHFRVDEDGFFFFADRAKDTLKVSGSQVSPVEIENVLLSHPDRLISEVTVAGVSGGRTDDEKIPHAWIVLSPKGRKVGSAKVIEQLGAWHQERLSKYKWLRGGIETVKEIPKNPTGKVLRRVLQDRYERNHGVKAKL